jgi:hypothetical protein
MTFLKMVGATALLTLLPVTTMAQTAPSAGECDAWFAKADKNKADYIMTKQAFVDACGKGSLGMPSN